MKRRIILVTGLTIMALISSALAAEAHGRRFSFSFSIGFGGGHHGPYRHYAYSPGHVYYGGIPGYYYGYYNPAPVVTYVYRPYRNRVYRTYIPERRYYSKGYGSYTPRRYYRRTYYR